MTEDRAEQVDGMERSVKPGLSDGLGPSAGERQEEVVDEKKEDEERNAGEEELERSVEERYKPHRVSREDGVGKMIERIELVHPVPESMYTLISGEQEEGGEPVLKRHWPVGLDGEKVVGGLPDEKGVKAYLRAHPTAVRVVLGEDGFMPTKKERAIDLEAQMKKELAYFDGLLAAIDEREKKGKPDKDKGETWAIYRDRRKSDQENRQFWMREKQRLTEEIDQLEHGNIPERDRTNEPEASDKADQVAASRNFLKKVELLLRRNGSGQ